MGTFISLIINYLRYTKITKILIHALVVMIVVMWTGAVYVGVTKFDTIMNLYERYQNRTTISVERVIRMTDTITRFMRLSSSEISVDRIYLSLFHDGKVTVDGRHFIYLSRTVELDSIGVSSQIRYNTNVPLSMFPVMMRDIGRGECHVIEKVTESLATYRFLNDQNIKTKVVCPLVNDKGELIGVVGVDTTKRYLTTREIEDTKVELRRLSKLIGSIVMENG